MNTSGVLLFIYLLISFLGLIPVTLYAVRYHIKSKGAWRDHHLSQTLMYLAMILGINFAFIIFNTFWVFITGASYSLRVPISMIFYALLSAVLWRQLWSFEKIQRDSNERGKIHDE